VGLAFSGALGAARPVFRARAGPGMREKKEKQFDGLFRRFADNWLKGGFWGGEFFG